MLWCDKAIFQNGDFALSADIRIEPHGVFAVIGPSGAGKSTLLGGIAGFVPQTKGQLFWQDQDCAPRQRYGTKLRRCWNGSG